MKTGGLLIAPSLLSADFSRLGEEIAAVESAGADMLHLDIMDGHFVPNLTIGPPVVRSLRKHTKLPFDAHLMIEKPEVLIGAFAEAGADYISVHAETCPHLHRTLSQIREAGCRAGAALNPSTPVETLSHILDQLDFVLIMSVNPGFGGQTFIPSALGKITALRKMAEREGKDIPIQVDGGVGPDNAGAVTEAGARILVAGSAVFQHPPYIEVIARMRSVARSFKGRENQR